MLETLEQLLVLQALDIQIEQTESRLAEIPREMGELETKQEQKETVMLDIQAELDEQMKLQRKLEAELQDNEEKLVKFNIQLNQIKNNEEYRAMLKQIDTIRYQNNEIENAILETFEDLDKQKIKKVKFKQELANFKQEIEQALSQKKKEQHQIQTHLDELKAEHLETRKSIASDVLAHYDKLVNFNRVPAVVKIVSETCGGCHLSIRPKILIEIRRNDQINYCESCTRFLYWKTVFVQETE